MTEDPRDEPGLFDLPLEAPPPSFAESAAASEPEDEPAELSGAGAPPARRRPPARSGSAAPRGSARPETLPLFDTESVDESPRDQRGGAARSGGRGATFEGARGRLAALRAGPVALPDPPPAAASAPLAPRLWGTGGDLVIVAATGAVAALGARWLGAPIGVEQIVPLTLFLLAWSFVYFVVPLAFWGATPGMSWAGLVARSSASEPLSFGQAAMRWLGTWLTWATLGLGGLLALTGRSLSDRLSGSSTYPMAAMAAMAAHGTPAR